MEKRKHYKRFAGRELGRRSGKISLLGEGMEGWLSAHGMDFRHHMLMQLWKNWEVVMGEEIAKIAYPLGHRKDILLVGGEDACALQELSYYVPEVLERVNAFMDEEYFHKVELHLMLGKTSLLNPGIAAPPPVVKPVRPPRLGNLKLPSDSLLAACYDAYVRLFDGEREKQ